VNALLVEFTGPEKSYPPVETVALEVPAEKGRLTVLPGHEPFVCLLTGGDVKIRTAEGEEQTWVVEKGTMTVFRDGVTILAEVLTAAQQ